MRPTVKICGMMRPEDIAAVNSAMPDYIGFVFAPSRLQIDDRTAGILKERLDYRIKAVGVFVNEKAGVIANLYRSGILDMIQLHGDEDENYIARLKDLCGCPVIKAIGIADVLPRCPENADTGDTGGRFSCVPPKNADYLLFDTLSEQRGSAGKVFDWNVLKDYNGLPYFLAGGLTAANVAEAITLLSPFCVDVSSGVETGGKKDASKIEEFVRLARRI